MGLLPEIKDYRTVLLNSFQAPVSLPKSFKTDISMLLVEDQGQRGSCTWNSLTYAMMLFAFWDVKKVPDLSWRHGYAMTKFIDGIMNVEGTFLSVALKVAKETGTATAALVPNNTSLSHTEFIDVPQSPEIFQEAANAKIKSFAGVLADPFHVKQAIFQNGFVLAAITVGTDMYTLPLKPLPFYGRHALFFFGFEDLEDGSTDYFFLNSWSKNWGVEGVGRINSKDYFTPSFSYIDSIYTLADVPQELIDEAKRRAYRPTFKFTRSLKLGDNHPDVKMLQDILKYEGCISPLDLPISTTYFGETTRKALLIFQQRYEVAPLRTLLNLNGQSFGPSTLELTNKFYSPETKLLDQWCLAIQNHEGYYLPGEHVQDVGPNGSLSYRNKNPGNIKFVGQARAIGKDVKGFCVFATYADGYAELKDMLTRCATGKNGPRYRSDMTLLEFFQVYAPSSDSNNPYSYAYQVAKALKVDINTKIYTLV